MQIIKRLSDRFATALEDMVDAVDNYAGMIRATNDAKHGDYQFNGAMPLAKKAGLGNPRDVAQKLLASTSLSDLCGNVEVAGPGFINLRLSDDFIASELCRIVLDDSLAIEPVETAETVLIDFSSPNVAKPMHVGHIRSTVIGDSLAKLFRRKGYQVITDNHLGDWGTQFGIIIYGYKHFGDPDSLKDDPIGHLSGLYRHVQSLIEYHKSVQHLPVLKAKIEDSEADLRTLQTQAPNSEDAKSVKKHKKSIDAAQRRVATMKADLHRLQEKVEEVQSNDEAAEVARQHQDVGDAVLIETAKLHQGDQENRALWDQFLPYCLEEIDGVYARLNVKFDHTLGESFYHPMLGKIVDDLVDKNLAVESDGAICVFLDGFDAPMIVRKRDGAFLYATTDLATLTYRKEQFDPAKILYVVDSRQSEHFQKLFAATSHIGLSDIDLVHVNFGTVLGKDGKPMKTRSGSLIGLEGLLDDAVARAHGVVCDPQRLEKFDPPMDEFEQRQVSEVVGIGAIKFADLSHHRSSDYRFDVEKMVALEGNTATYIQYQYARTQSILRRVEFSLEDRRQLAVAKQVSFSDPAERALALQLLRYDDAIVSSLADYAPNQMTDYLIETARQYARFNDSCSVIAAPNDALKDSRTLLVFATGRVLKDGLAALGIQTVDRM